MELKVEKTFADKVKPYISYKVGEIITLPDERAKDAIEKGLAVEMVAEKPEAKEEAKPKKKPAKKKG